MLGYFSCFCCRLLFSKLFFLKNFFQEYNQSVNQFGSRPGQTKHFLGPDQFGSRPGQTKHFLGPDQFGSKLFTNIISRQQNLVGKEQENDEGVNGIYSLANYSPKIYQLANYSPKIYRLANYCPKI